MNTHQPSSSSLTKPNPPPGKNMKRAATSETTTHRSSSDGRGGIDTHPYQRGSVIEVIYGGGRVEDSDLEEDFEEDESYSKSCGLAAAGKKAKVAAVSGGNDHQKGLQEVRLADIIDRCQSDTPNHEDPAYRFKYYIHYRDYNRRMDEWITDPVRIVSPPSVGNAKVREMKKAKIKAEKAALQQQQQQHLESTEEASKRRKISSTNGENQSISPGGRLTVQRASSRRAIAAITNNNNNAGALNTTGSSTSANSTACEIEEEGNKNQNSSGSVLQTSTQSDENEQSRLTRRQRRKSRGNNDNESTQQNKTHTSASSLVTTFLPGQESIQDKVVTVAARELDEHEGLDEASLREHEEVTKVKNVAEVQLGKYRMNAWYFSPIPKDMISNGSTVDVLYVCEFTLNFFPRREELLRFQAKDLPRNKRHPPGNEIYR